MTKILNIVRALYDYTPESNSQEMTFIEDELLLITDNGADDWWYAERVSLNAINQSRDKSDPLCWDDVSAHNSTTSDVNDDAHHIEWDDDKSPETYGWIPSNYVQEAECQFIASALYDFVPEADDDQVPLKASNQVLVYDAMSDPDWWLIKNNQGQYGWVPSNYLGLNSNNQNEVIKQEQENVFSELASKSVQLIDTSIKKPLDDKIKKQEEEKLKKQDQEHKRKEEEKLRKQEEEEEKKRRKEEEKQRKEEEKTKKKEKIKKETPKQNIKSPEPVSKQEKPTISEPINPVKLSPNVQHTTFEAPISEINSPIINVPLVPKRMNSVPSEPAPQIRERKPKEIQPPPILPRKKHSIPEKNISNDSIEQLPTLPTKKSGLLTEWKTTKDEQDKKPPELPLKKEHKLSSEILPKKALPNRPKKLPNSQKPDPSKTRMWKDKSGAYSVEAQFVSVNYDNNDSITVVLCKLNGNKVSIPLSKLSEDDALFVKSKMKELVGDPKNKETEASLNSLIKAVKNASVAETKQPEKTLQPPLQPQVVNNSSNSSGYTDSMLSNIQQFLARNSQRQAELSTIQPNNQVIGTARPVNTNQQTVNQATSLLHIQNIQQQQQLQAQQRLLAQHQQEQEQLKNQVIQLRQQTQQQNAILQMKQQEQIRMQQEQQNALLQQRQLSTQYLPHQMGMIAPMATMQQMNHHQYRSSNFQMPQQMMPRSLHPQQVPQMPQQQFPIYNQPNMNPYRPPYPRWNGSFQ